MHSVADYASGSAAGHAMTLSACASCSRPTTCAARRDDVHGSSPVAAARQSQLASSAASAENTSVQSSVAVIPAGFTWARSGDWTGRFATEPRQTTTSSSPVAMESCGPRSQARVSATGPSWMMQRSGD